MAATDTQLLDQEGVSFISFQLSQRNCVFNEYHREIGIDGIVEYREEPYKSPGKLFACQIKSGNSFFTNETGDSYKLYLDNKHMDYWLKCNLPVVFFIYSPSQKEAYWTKISPFEIAKTQNNIVLSIPKTNKLSSTSGKDFYCTCFGKLYEADDDFEDVKSRLSAVTFIDYKIKVSALELFINGLMDNCTQLFFGTQVIGPLLDYKACAADMGCFSYPDFSFYMDFFSTLSFHSIIMDTFEKEFSEYYKKTNLIPIFLKPLSLNGNKFCEYLRTKHNFPIYDRFFLGLNSQSEPFVDVNNFLGKVDQEI